MTKLVDIAHFLSKKMTTFDVRTPEEYSQGHIPGAVNLPLFSNEERAAIGKTYKQEGRARAIETGLSYAAPNLLKYVSKAKGHLTSPHAKIHCWRGGMRSAAMAELLELTGVNSATLRGGYKSFRRWVLKSFAKKRKIHLLGGLTGSNKTLLLKALRGEGEQVLDLEAIANHRGSAFGALGKQPTNEQFENEIATILEGFDSEKAIWIEDESRIIGTCSIPHELFSQMRETPLLFVEIPLEERIHNLSKIYREEDKEKYIEGVKRLQKKLGGARTKEAVELIEKGCYVDTAYILLKYYDKAYRYSLQKRKIQITSVKGGGVDQKQLAQRLLKYSLKTTQKLIQYQ